MEQWLAQFLGNLGVGGILAYAMFLIYRKDAVEAQKRFLEHREEFREIVRENTEAITKLSVISDRMWTNTDKNLEVSNKLLESVDRNFAIASRMLDRNLELTSKLIEKTKHDS